jgi:hypothetical protein
VSCVSLHAITMLYTTSSSYIGILGPCTAWKRSSCHLDLRHHSLPLLLLLLLVLLHMQRRNGSIASFDASVASWGSLVFLSKYKQSLSRCVPEHVPQ